MSLPAILWNNLIASATLTVTDTAAGYDKENLKDWRNFTYWVAGSAADKTIIIDLGSPKSCDSFAIVGHNLATAGASVNLESHTANAWTGDQAERVAAFEPTTDKALAKTFTAAQARYWRITIGSSPSVAPQLAIVFLGAKMAFPIYPDAPLDYITEDMNITREDSKGGYMLGNTVYYTPTSASVTFTYFPLSFCTSDYDVFWAQHGRLGKPFFYLPDLGSWASDVRFVRLPASYKYRKQLADNLYLSSLQLEFEGVAE
jgi:hypothetical protein